MSYEISNVTLLGEFTLNITEERYRELCDRYAGKPGVEGSIFDADWVELCCSVVDGVIFPSGWWWLGSNTALMCEVLAEFSGNADLLVTWEGGDSFGGVRLRDGKVSHHMVVQALGAEVQDENESTVRQFLDMLTRISKVSE